MISNVRKVLGKSKRLSLRLSNRVIKKVNKTKTTKINMRNVAISEGHIHVSGSAKIVNANLQGQPITYSVTVKSTNEMIHQGNVTMANSKGRILPFVNYEWSISIPLEEVLQQSETVQNEDWLVHIHLDGVLKRKYNLSVPLSAVDEHFIKEAKSYDQVYIVPYRTKKGTLSFAIEREKCGETVHHLPNFLTGYELKGKQVQLEGWLDHEYLSFFTVESTEVSVAIKRRGYQNAYHFPVELTRTGWKASIDYQDLSFSKGVWDFYLAIKSDVSTSLGRIRAISGENMKNQRVFYFSQGKEAYRGVHYRTKQKGLSITIQSSLISAKNLIIETHGERADLRAKFKTSTFNLAEGQEVQAFNLILRKRDTESMYSFSLVKEEYDSESYFLLSGSIDYEELLAEDRFSRQLWDGFLEVVLSDESRLFRIKTRRTKINATSKRNYVVEGNPYQMYFYSTVYGRLSLSYGIAPLARGIDRYQFEKNDLIIDGFAYIRNLNEELLNADKKIQLVIKNRLSEEEIDVPTKLVMKKRKDTSENVPDQSGFHAKVSLVELQQLLLEPKEILDFYVEVHMGEFVRREKIGLTEYTYFKDDVLTSKSLQSKYDTELINYCVTITPRGNFKIETFKLLPEHLEMLNQAAQEKQTWLIGERPDTAQDTGYHFFKYCRTTYPEMDVYYAINEDSKDLKNIEHLGNVLMIGSKEHFEVAARATALIGSHDFDYFLPYKGIQSENYKKAVRVFLQHGVLGRKMVEYNKQFYRYPFDIFIVSSTDEKFMVMEQLGYAAEDMRVTGLSRFDELLRDHNPKKEILLIPTWREWLNTTENLLNSEYYRRYTNFLKNPRLIELLRVNGLKLNFYPHYRMQQFFDEFGSDFAPEINLVQLGEKSVQELLKENALMITDYSSVSFDFTYLSKPVIFYHFDRDSFFKSGIMRPFDETFIGDVANTEDELISFIENSAQNGFKENEDVPSKKHMIFDTVDQANCERIFAEIQKEIKRKQLAEGV